MDIKTKKKIVALAVIGFVVAIIDALFLEKYFFEINRFFNGKKGNGQRITLLFLTDLHFKKYLDKASKKLASKINEMNPDLILIAGDLIDEDGRYAPAKEFFGMLHHSIPKVGILGNHDHKNRVRLGTYKQLYGQNNGILLLNASQEFTLRGKRLVVTGVDDFIEGHPSLAKAVQQVGREENHLLLIHSPLQQEVLINQIKELNKGRPENCKLNIKYIFAGHNHGGQVCIFGFAPIMPEYAGNYLKGWYNREWPYLYLSKGFGTSTLPFRFGARAEVSIFYLGV